MSDRPKGKGKARDSKQGNGTTSKSGSSGRSGRRGKGSRKQGYDASTDQHDAELMMPWPPTDPAWWATLASQLPAAWGTGSGIPAMTWDGEGFVGWGVPEEKPKLQKDSAAGNEEEAGTDDGAAKPGAAGAAPDMAAAESLLDALAPTKREKGADPDASKVMPKAPPIRHWVVAEERSPNETSEVEQWLSAEKLLGRWVDSQGNAVHVLSTDAYEWRLLATLSKPGRPEKFLSLKPIRLGAGWQCGHSILDPIWTSSSQMHWVAADGRVTVWVRPASAEKGAAGGNNAAETEKAEEKKVDEDASEPSKA
eukprot:gb/GFBE01036134.1/.p1 GENE.gb/GFBE01036134.1/~~gb/GFBE01036134.1/.p1  ORF type:complete len:309 (+),score=69.46 gb/GFBE01036134.1/:1-927(+)